MFAAGVDVSLERALAWVPISYKVYGASVVDDILDIINNPSKIF